MATQKIEHAAPKKQGLTLDQLAAFVQAAMRSGAAGTEVVGAGITFSGKLQKISVEVDTQAPVAEPDRLA